MIWLFGKAIYSAVRVAKYAIIEMIQVGFSQDTIQTLTGFGDEVFKPCQEIVNEGNKEKINIEINSRIKETCQYHVFTNPE